MKRLAFLVTLAIALLMPSCKSGKSAIQSLPQPVAEDHSGGDYVFPEGFYYAFDFEGSQGNGFELEEAVKALSINKFRPVELWYKPGSSSCVPPGSDMAMTVMVEPVLLLRFTKKQAGIERLGYQAVEQPSAGSCAYVVRRYRF
ncbi:MAG: hypothetical protein IPM52_12220 [Bacteroidetes bacterium]|nr:hypothetical protein [Bacteroidota bacterium]